MAPSPVGRSATNGRCQFSRCQRTRNKNSAIVPFRISTIVCAATSHRRRKTLGPQQQGGRLPRRSCAFGARRILAFVSSTRKQQDRMCGSECVPLNATGQVDGREHEHRVLSRIRVDFPAFWTNLGAWSGSRRSIKQMSRDLSYPADDEVSDFWVVARAHGSDRDKLVDAVDRAGQRSHDFLPVHKRAVTAKMRNYRSSLELRCRARFLPHKSLRRGQRFAWRRKFCI